MRWALVAALVACSPCVAGLPFWGIAQPGVPREAIEALATPANELLMLSSRTFVFSAQSSALADAWAAENEALIVGVAPKKKTYRTLATSEAVGSIFAGGELLPQVVIPADGVHVFVLDSGFLANSEMSVSALSTCTGQSANCRTTPPWYDEAGHR